MWYARLSISTRYLLGHKQGRRVLENWYTTEVHIGLRRLRFADGIALSSKYSNIKTRLTG